MRWINSKVVLYSTGKYNQYPVINHNGKNYESITYEPHKRKMNKTLEELLSIL